jgi:hypothetical protein
MTTRNSGASFRRHRQTEEADARNFALESIRTPFINYDGDVLGKFYGQAERPISTGKLHALLRFHLPPIKVVVFDWPSYAAVAALGDLISG